MALALALILALAPAARAADAPDAKAQAPAPAGQPSAGGAQASKTQAAKASPAKETFVDGIAAQVGSDIVLASEVNRFAAPMEKKMRAAGAPEDEIRKMRADLLERMIERRLIEQAVRRVKIEATDAEVDSTISSIAEENGLTTDQLKKTVAAKGMTYDAYRKQIRGEIERQKLIAGAVQAQVHVDEDEIRALYKKRYADQPTGGEEVHLRHILIPFGADTGVAEKDACDEARRARARVAAGEDFAKVAAAVSAVNPQAGGDVGWVHLSHLAAWMSVPVSGMKAGEMTDVIRMPFGCNVLFLVERRPFHPKTYEQARAALRKEIFNEKMAKQYQIFVDTLRQQTYIERKGLFADAPMLTDSDQQ